MMRGYGISYVYEVLIPEVGSNIYQVFHLDTHVHEACFCFDLQFYTRMDKFVSSTGSESTELAKADDDDDGVDDGVDADSDDNEGITMQL